jgi:hypothetical protein
VSFRAVGRYLKRVVVAVDQLANTLKGGREDETASSAEGRYDWTQPKTKALTLTKILNWLDPGHTDRAKEYDQYGRPQAHGLEDRPPGAATRPQHHFVPGAVNEQHCAALVEGGVECAAPIYHPVHDMPEDRRPWPALMLCVALLVGGGCQQRVAVVPPYPPPQPDVAIKALDCSKTGCKNPDEVCLSDGVGHICVDPTKPIPPREP